MVQELPQKKKCARTAPIEKKCAWTAPTEKKCAWASSDVTSARTAPDAISGRITLNVNWCKHCSEIIAQNNRLIHFSFTYKGKTVENTSNKLLCTFTKQFLQLYPRNLNTICIFSRIPRSCVLQELSINKCTY